MDEGKDTQARVPVVFSQETTRNLFAAVAMHALVSVQTRREDDEVLLDMDDYVKDMADRAFRIADTMMTEREW